MKIIIFISIFFISISSTVLSKKITRSFLKRKPNNTLVEEQQQKKPKKSKLIAYYIMNLHATTELSDSTLGTKFYEEFDKIVGISNELKSSLNMFAEYVNSSQEYIPKLKNADGDIKGNTKLFYKSFNKLDIYKIAFNVFGYFIGEAKNTKANTSEDLTIFYDAIKLKYDELLKEDKEKEQ